MLQVDDNEVPLVNEARRKARPATVCGVEADTFLLGVIATAVCVTCVVAIGIAVVGLGKLDSLSTNIRDLNEILKAASDKISDVHSDTSNMVVNTNVLMSGIPKIVKNTDVLLAGIPTMAVNTYELCSTVHPISTDKCQGKPDDAVAWGLDGLSPKI